MFEDTSDAGEVFLQLRDIPKPPVPTGGPFHLPHPHVSAPSHIKPEYYDVTTDWTECQIYFDQLGLYGWEDERKAMVLGVYLKGKSRMVLAGLNAVTFCISTELYSSGISTSLPG